MMKIVFTYKNGYKHTLTPNRPLTRALAEMYRIKYASSDNDRGVVILKQGRVSLDLYIGVLEESKEG